LLDSLLQEIFLSFREKLLATQQKNGKQLVISQTIWARIRVT